MLPPIVHSPVSLCPPPIPSLAPLIPHRLHDLDLTIALPSPKPTDFKFNMEDIVSVCKRRGFVFQSSEIYNGFNGFYDYGPIGVELKNNIKKIWWRDMVTPPPFSNCI